MGAKKVVAERDLSPQPPVGGYCLPGAALLPRLFQRLRDVSWHREPCAQPARVGHCAWGHGLRQCEGSRAGHPHTAGSTA